MRTLAGMMPVLIAALLSSFALAADDESKPAAKAEDVDPPALEPLVPAPVPELALPPPPERRVVIVPPSAPEPAPAAAAPTPAARPALIAVPRDEMQERRARAAEVTNAIQIGPESLILDELRARGELVPGVLQIQFGYRFATDDVSAPHHLFLGGLESGHCAAGEACGLRWFVRGGFGPRSEGALRVASKTVHTDTLGWSANVGQAGLGYSGRSVSFLADGQLEQLAADYLRTSADGRTSLQESANIQQIRLRATLSFGSGAWSGSLRAAGYLYGGDDSSKLKDVPLRGALVDDEVPGLASALQTFAGRAEGRWDGVGGTSLALSYGYLGYTGATWSAAHLGSLSLSQKIGRFRIGAGVVIEDEVDSTGAGFMTVFGTGSVGAAF